jgi:GNAT superfamily N-acetyltransferase
MNRDSSTGIDLSMRLSAYIHGGVDDPSNFIDEFNGYLECPQDDGVATVGKINFSVIRLFDDYQKFIPFEVMDDDSVAAGYLDILDSDGEFGFREEVESEIEQYPQKILTINSLHITPKCRGLGIGLKAMALIISRGWGCELAILKAQPLQFVNNSRDSTNRNRREPGAPSYPLSESACTSKLMSHYAKLGFKAIGDTKLMVLGLSYDHQSQWRNAGVFDALTLPPCDF